MESRDQGPILVREDMSLGEAAYTAWFMRTYARPAFPVWDLLGEPEQAAWEAAGAAAVDQYEDNNLAQRQRVGL